MSLSEILSRLNHLKRIDLTPLDKLGPVFDEVAKTYVDVKFTNKYNITTSAKSVKDALANYRNEVESLKAILEKTIYSGHNEFIAQGEKIWAEQYNIMSFEENLEWIGQWPPNGADYEKFSELVNQHCNWQQPALIFGANKTNIMQTMVGADPLYSVERYPEYHTLQKESFHVDYHRKIKCYVPDEMKLLPRDAFSVAAVYNQFPFLPWKRVTNYINQLTETLAPGGMLIFNYNNCRLTKGFQYFEQQSMTYTVPEMYYEYCQSLGLELQEDFVSPNLDFAFMTFTKPGSIDLVKKYPAVGMISQQPTLNNPLEHKQRLKKLTGIFKS